MINGKSGCICLFLSLLLTAAAHAHKPIFSDGTAQDANTAINIDDIDISYVIYHEVTEESPQLWLTFEARSGQEVFLQLGVPVIERLQDFRPALALLGPGLPAVDLPFTVPEGLGGIVLAPGTEVEPEFFHEPFTGTDSWILGEIQTVLSESGRYYAVAYVPNGQTGKLWVAPGRQEVFGLADIFSLPTIINQVREFHEVPAAGIPCFLPLLAIMFLSWGGLRLVKIKRNRIPRCR